MDITWETPPGADRGVTASRTKEEQQIADELAKNPGQWARVREYNVSQTSKSNSAAQVASLINKGERAGFKNSAGKFEAVSRKLGGKHVLYARYISNE